MKISISFKGDKEFQRTLNQYAKTTKKGMTKTLVQVAGRAGEDLAFTTSVWGNKKASQKAMDKGVISDARTAYPKRGVIYKMLKEHDPRKAAAFNKAMRKEDVKAAEKIAASVMPVKIGKDNGSFLQKLRNRRGRVVNPKRVMVGLSAPEVNAIIKKNKATTGTGKAGWFSATRSLPGRIKNPLKWLKKGNNLGSSKVKESRRNTTVSITNKVKYIRQEITAGSVNRAVKKSNKNFLKFMKIVLAKAEQKSR